MIMVFVALLGLAVGSFLNVVVYRLPIMLNRAWQHDCEDFLKLPLTKFTPKIFNLCWPNSHCPHCNYSIGLLENIPVLSYLLLAGKCRNCKAKISLRYLLVEIITCLLTLVVFQYFGISYSFICAAVITWCLIALTLIDFEQQLLPDNITLPMLWLGLLAHSLGIFTNVPLNTAIIGAIAGYLSLWSLCYAYKLCTDKDGMGHGDFKLLAMFGAWLGWQLLPLIIFMAALLGSIFGIAMLLSKKMSKDIPMAFGPYLAISGWVAMLWGKVIMNCYFHLAGLDITL